MSKLGIKSFLVVLGSLLLGLILGVLLSITVVKNILPNASDKGKDRSTKIRRMLYKITDASEEQKIQIDEVLENKRDVFFEMEERHHLQKKQFIEEVRKEIEPFLEPAQIEKMNDKIKRFENRRKRR